jgi:hypothetical protein
MLDQVHALVEVLVGGDHFVFAAVHTTKKTAVSGRHTQQ